MSTSIKIPKHKVLLVFANPRNTQPLRLGQEVRAICESIRLANNRDEIWPVYLFASTIHDLRRALLRENFTIVHFSGHGSSEGLALEDETGNPYMPPPEALAELLGAHPSIQCVIFNACFTREQGILTSFKVPFTIYMEGAISDEAAIEFSRGFYDALGAGHQIRYAYEEGCRTVGFLKQPGIEFNAQIFERQPNGYLFLLYENQFQRFDLLKDKVVIGRGECDVKIPDNFYKVSRVHAQITFSDDTSTIFDLDSTHGTYVDGQRLDKHTATPIRHRRRIFLGGSHPSEDGVCILEFSLDSAFPTKK